MEMSIILAALLFALLSGSASVFVFSLYRGNPTSRGKDKRGGWIRLWEILPSESGFSYVTLILASMLGLFLELLLIRWVSSEIRIFAFFKNFVLIACFLGFGLGGSLCRRSINLLSLLVPLVTVSLIIKLPWEPFRTFIATLPNYLGSMSEVHLWGVPSIPMNWASLGLLATACALVCPLFALLALIFIPIGQWIGWCLENAPNGIWAYSTNLLASLAGILLYTFLCLYYQPPWVWIAAGGSVALMLFWGSPVQRWTVAASFGLCAVLAGFNLHPGTSELWSPYQKVTLLPQREAHVVEIYTNETWHQQIVDLSPEFVASHPNLFERLPPGLNAYNLPYRFSPSPPSVLILGAGTGNDVAAALRNGAGRVVAVEIDPLILQLGTQLHFERPYASPRVQAVVQDARRYVQSCEERFDLIVFSLLDSHTTSSHYTNIRIDNFVYTVEALRAAQKLLHPQGVLVIKFQVETPWIAGRLERLMTAVFGRASVQLRADNNSSSTVSFFIEASETQVRQAFSDEPFASHTRRQGTLKTQNACLTTDDWPYFYQHEPGIPASVIAISVALLLLSTWAFRQTGIAVKSIEWHFFFLGAAFLLLEVQIVSRMALLFGTTWLVNSIVIAGVLLLIVGSNFVVRWFPQIPVKAAYLGLFLSISLAYLVPTHWLFFDSRVLSALVAVPVSSLPVFFAGIIFIRSFANAAFSGTALGANLIGALLGGLLESLSYWTGLKALLLLAALLYAASYMATYRTSAASRGCLT